MKFGCSLEMVNLLTSGPGVFTRQSKKFWVDYMKFIAAAGFTGIELPYNCFHADAMAFETGRAGCPCNETVLQEKYGGPETFIRFLKEIGVTDGVIDVHISAQDATLELLACAMDPEAYYTLAEKLFFAGLDHAANLKAGCLVVSPSPELGWLYKVFGEDLSDFEEKTSALLEKLVEAAREKGVAIAFKNDFWGYFRGERRAALLARIPELFYAPDPAHLLIEGAKPQEAVSSYKNRLACVRMNDTAFEDVVGNWKCINAELPVEGNQKVFADCGDGKADLKGLVSDLKASGYDGWVICENRKTLDVYKGLLKLGWFVQYGLENA